MERVYIDRVALDRISLNEAVRRISTIACNEAKRVYHVVTANAQFVQIARHDVSFSDLVQKADLVVADGVPLVWASRLLGSSLPGRVNGTDLMVRLCESAAINGSTLYLLGGYPGAADRAALRLGESYPGLKVVGVDCPPFGFTEDRDIEAAVAHRIEQAKPDLLFVGLGAPKQEFWIQRHSHLPAKVMIGVGGSFELIAGVTRRAPLLLQKIGCEWLWRLCMEPKRLLKRYLVGNSLFVWLVFQQWIKEAFLVRSHN